jgi:hypothetical protein
MGCIDIEKGLLSEEEVYDRVASFCDHSMSSEEADTFLDHTSKCDTCHKAIFVHAALLKNIRILATYNKLVAAEKSQEWEEVLSLEKELVLRGYSEELYPIKDKVSEAKLKGISASDEYDKINLEYVGNKLKGTIASGCELRLELFGKMELKKLFPTEVILAGDLPTHQTYPEEQEPSATVETDNFIVKIYKGKLYAHFTIEPK